MAWPGDLAGWPGWGVALGLWAVLGAALAAVMTPSGRLLRRSAKAEDRPAVFAAQFALSHACWLVAYPLAGVLGSAAGVPVAMLVLGALGLASIVLALVVWRGGDEVLEHVHSDLPEDHPHLRGAVRTRAGWVHRHVFVIDDEHRVWPTHG